MAAEPTAMHSASTSLPEDLYERVLADGSEAERNLSQQLRWIVRDYYRRLDKERQAILRVPKDSEPTRVMPLPTSPSPLKPYVGTTPPDTTVTWNEFDDGHTTR